MDLTTVLLTLCVLYILSRWFLIKFGRRPIITLGDADTLSMVEISKLLAESSTPSIDKMAEDKYLCRTCKGDLTLVLPEIRLGDMSLFECGNCRQRFYVEMYKGKLL